jgi:MerR family transcriptional regulator/heat shock protein HspR
MAPNPGTLTISQVSRRTGIPITTLRFYERELSGLFRIRKTAGGHRRYGEADVARFFTVRRLTETEGVGLSEVRGILMSRGEPDSLRVDVDHFLEVQAAETDVLQALERRVATLEARIAALDATPAPRRRWLGRRTSKQ